MKILGIDEVKAKVISLGDRINVPENLLPTFGYNEDLARPEIRVSNKSYEYVIIERGKIISQSSYSNLDDLLYVAFRDITFSMALEFEKNNRIKGQDFRRVLFTKHEELLRDIDLKFYDRLVDYHYRILKENPFDDK